ncbi:MAG TPA: protein meaA, partial [Actinomycetota bacterium]|nr:protein meaA [Actinomycetota bacterium]
SRGTFIFPPAPSMRLTTDMIEWTLQSAPKWNPINVCSYHLQEAGAGPVLEIAFTLANAVAVLDAVKEGGRVSPEDFAALVGRISFFCNAGIRIVEEMCKIRAFARLWDRITQDRYGVEDPKFRRFRYGVQVNSLGLTAHQPENNVYRILLEMLAVTMSKDSRARAVQLPAWNEALGLPRPWDQQWSLRAQQIAALETDLLEYEDIFAGSKVIDAKTEQLESDALKEMQVVLDKGGSLQSIDYMKERLVSAHAERQRAIESGDQTVVGVNAYTESEPSLLESSSQEAAYQATDPESENEALQNLESWRKGRDAREAERSISDLKKAAEGTENLMEATLRAATAGVTTGEWAGALREVFGEYRAPTGISGASAPSQVSTRDIDRVRADLKALAKELSVKRLRLLVGKPGLDGHSNAAEQVAVRARDVGFEVIYQGIRLTPAEIAKAAAEEDVDAIGISILSGGHNFLVKEVLDRLAEQGIDPKKVPVIVGGVIPDEDAARLEKQGIARVFTPRDYNLTEAVGEIVELIRKAKSA